MISATFGLMFCIAMNDEVVLRMTTYLDGKPIDLALTQSHLARSPSWPNNRDNPPLSPRKATQIARSQLKKLVKDSESWRIEAITLRPVGSDSKWIYVIEAASSRELGGKRIPYKIIVLMDGTVLEEIQSGRRPNLR